MQAIYVSSNQFKVSTDKTSEFLAGRRVRALCGSDYKYSTVQSSTYSSPDTTITLEEGELTSNLSEVHYGIVNIGEQGSFPKHSHDGNEGTGGGLSLLTLEDTPSSYEEGKYLRSTTSGVELEDLNDYYYTESEVDTLSGTLQANIDNKSDISHLHDDRYYTESEVDTISGTLQTNIDTKTTVFLTNGAPSDSIGSSGDVAIDQNIGTVYEKSDPFSDSGTFTPIVGADDGNWNEYDHFYPANINIMIGRMFSSVGLTAWIRCPNITIPEGSTITSAYARLTSTGNYSDTVYVKFYLNDVDDAVAPINVSQGKALVLTSAVVPWTVPGFTTHSKYNSPSLVSILQEVIDRSGWSSGNAVQIVIKDNGTPANYDHRYVASLEDVDDDCIEFHIEWDTPPTWEEKLSPDFLKLSDTPIAYDDGKYLKSTTSGIEFSDDLYTKSEVDTISGTLQTNIDGKADTVHTHDDRYYTESEVDTISGTLQTSIDGMPVTFLELEDTPTTYSGSDGKYIKTTSSGVEFSQISLLDLADTPTTYSGASGKYVKTTNSGIEFSDDYRFGDTTDYTQIETDGRLHFYGNAQPVNFTIIDSLSCDASHLAPLEITSLSVADGILTSGLDTATGASRRIEVVGVDGGIYVKGRDKGSYTQGDTTHESYRIKIKLNTTNAVWEQSGEWKVILDILSGDITGDFTVYMPPFSIMEYSTLEGYITVDGTTYAEITSRGFDVSLAGPAAAEELFSNNETTGSGIVVEVASTAGFYVGNEVFVSDSSNSEWTRIKEIVTDTSITVDLTNSYTTANDAKFNMFDYIKTTLTVPIQRGLFRAKVFKASENSGVQLQMPVPQQTDPTKDLGVVLQYISTVDNPGLTLVSKWRIQYFFKTLGEDIPESYQYGELVYVDVTPPATKCNYIATLATLTQADHQGKNLLAMQVTRLGADVGDTYTGDFKLAAIITTMPWKQLGYEA